MKFCHNTNFTLPKQSQRSRSVFQDGSRSLGLFWKDNNPSYNRRNTVLFFTFSTVPITSKHSLIKELYLVIINSALFSAMENSKLYEALLLAADEEEILKEIENENEENFKQRDSHGKSLFIIAVEKIKSVNVFKALLNKVDFTVRDDNGKTAIDIMLEDEDFPDDAADVWRDFVREKILGSKKVDLEDMVLKGWLDLWLEEDTTDEMDNEVKDFLEKLPPLIVSLSVEILKYMYLKP